MREYWLDPPQYSNPICPVYRDECEIIVEDSNGDVVGCDNCLKIWWDANDWQEKQYENEEALHGDSVFDARRELF